MPVKSFLKNKKKYSLLLPAIGMGMSMVLLLMEHFYMRYLQSHVQKNSDNGCCALISQVKYISHN